ncbi:C1 family peptidase [Rhizobium leguminosarum]|uniref:C1 family peptidase n=1 Tax=Rhizobium leguminosarum TaxID=384 RepID=UPI0036D94228
MSRVINVADQFGVFDESIWPYIPGNRSLPNGMTWDKLDSIAIDKGRRATFQKLDNLDQAKSEISAGRPVVVGFRVSENLMKYSGGIYQGSASQDGQDQFLGLTAVVLVAYDATTNAFRFANMWGTGWGEQGFGRISSSALQVGIDTSNMWSVAPAK